MTLRSEVRKFFSAARPVVKAHTINSIGQSILLIVSETGFAVLRSKACQSSPKGIVMRSISETGIWVRAFGRPVWARSRILTTIFLKKKKVWYDLRGKLQTEE